MLNNSVSKQHQNVRIICTHTANIYDLKASRYFLVHIACSSLKGFSIKCEEPLGDLLQSREMESRSVSSIVI